MNKAKASENLSGLVRFERDKKPGFSEKTRFLGYNLMAMPLDKVMATGVRCEL
ncbi:MAG: hypothetical protein GDA43_14650 [Hormoscilla sp. SP5CHS1]|nr:hypothetical protein [Hormoscilla sp. SP12CHS1]MBC6454278.1 hypothetical protein [Hormoscilla sp. SP5CHS1]